MVGVVGSNPIAPTNYIYHEGHEAHEDSLFNFVIFVSFVVHYFEKQVAFGNGHH